MSVLYLNYQKVSHAMPTLREKAYEYVTKPQPISAMWTIDGKEFPGTLEWVNDKPQLTVNEEISHSEGNSERQRSFLRDLFETHRQSAAFGACSTFGGVFLDRCVALSLNSTAIFAESAGYHQLKLLPQEIWFSPRVVNRNTSCTQTSLSDDRLYGVFRDGSIQQIESDNDQFKAAQNALDDPEIIWAGYAPQGETIALGKTGLGLTTSSSLFRSFSAIEGQSARIVSTLELTEINKSQGLSISDHMSAVRKLEMLISIISLSRFEFRCKEFMLDDESVAAQIWVLGGQPKKFDAPMRHEVLIDFTDHQTLRTAIESWFVQDKVFGLAIWVFHKAISETESGVSRFLFVCQAFEILGRTTNLRDKKLSRHQLNDAVERIGNALYDAFPKEQIERWQNLVASSNRASFSDILEKLFPTQLVEMAADFGSAGPEAYARFISDLRNTLIHMSGKNADDLNAAFRNVNNASYQMTLLFLLTIIERMGLPTPDTARLKSNDGYWRAFPI